MKWRNYLPDDVRAGLEQFHAEQPAPFPDREVITLALRDWLARLGYLDAPRPAPVDEYVETKGGCVKSSPDLISEMTYMAKHPTMFTKADMADLMGRAAEKMRHEKELLAKTKAVLLEVATRVAGMEKQLEIAISENERREESAN